MCPKSTCPSKHSGRFFAKEFRRKKGVSHQMKQENKAPRAPLFLSMQPSRLIRHTDQRLMSYNIEMTEITGGTFWKTYTAGQIAGTETFPAVSSLSDTRRFGRFWLLRQGETDTYTGIEKLGAEPFDLGFSGEYLSTRLGKRKKAIKECLLDQSVVAGIGNIYSDEILFAAHIRPARPANTLTKEEWTRLARMIPERLAYFIEKNAITPEEYLETKGQDYRNTPFLQVYGHGGELCPVCGETLCRTVIGGRSSVYCPACQKI